MVRSVQNDVVDGMLLILRRQTKGRSDGGEVMAAPAKKNAPTSSRPRLLGVLSDVPNIFNQKNHISSTSYSMSVRLFSLPAVVRCELFETCLSKRSFSSTSRLGGHENPLVSN